MPEERFDKPEFLVRLRAGDPEAWEEFVCGTEKMVYDIIIGIIPARKEEARELRQEVFKSAFTAIRGFRGGDCKIRTWLAKIAKNKTFSYLRKGTISEVPIGPDVDLPATGRPIGVRLEDQEMLIMFFKQLSEEEKETWWLHHCKGWPDKKIARLLGVNLGTITSRLSRLRGKFEECCRSYKAGKPTRLQLRKASGT